MAHQIDFTTGQAAIAYATGTETPWHGLGQTVDPHAPVEVWQKAAQLEWQALRAEVQFDSSVTGTRETYADKHVLYRSDCGAPLSVVSSDYRVVQPADILNFFGELAEAKQFSIETVGALMAGRRPDGGPAHLGPGPRRRQRPHPLRRGRALSAARHLLRRHDGHRRPVHDDPAGLQSAVDIHLRQLHQLVGGTITNLARTGIDEYGDEFFGIIVTLPNGKKKTVIFLADDEGNGPGSVQINDQV